MILAIDADDIRVLKIRTPCRQRGVVEDTDLDEVELLAPEPGEQAAVMSQVVVPGRRLLGSERRADDVKLFYVTRLSGSSPNDKRSLARSN